MKKDNRKQARVLNLNGCETNFRQSMRTGGVPQDIFEECHWLLSSAVRQGACKTCSAMRELVTVPFEEDDYTRSTREDPLGPSWGSVGFRSAEELQ